MNKFQVERINVLDFLYRKFCTGLVSTSDCEVSIRYEDIMEYKIKYDVFMEITGIFHRKKIINRTYYYPHGDDYFTTTYGNDPHEAQDIAKIILPSDFVADYLRLVKEIQNELKDDTVTPEKKRTKVMISEQYGIYLNDDNSKSYLVSGGRLEILKRLRGGYKRGKELADLYGGIKGSVPDANKACKGINISFRKEFKSLVDSELITPHPNKFWELNEKDYKIEWDMP